MTVLDLLRTKQRSLVTAMPTTSIVRAMELLLSNRVSCLPVLNDDNELVGILSDKDIFRSIYESGADYEGLTVGDLMTTEVIVGLETDDLSYIAGIMTTNRIRHVPIVDGTHLVELVSVGDIVKTQMSDITIENRYLWQYINGTYPG